MQEKENKTKRIEFGKSKVIKAANDLFSKNGYHATSVDQINQLAGKSSGAFYNYFKSKEDILKEVIKIKITRSEELLLVTKEKESAQSWVKRILQIYLSPEHRDSKEYSCPVTTLSQELDQLELIHESGLSDYASHFKEVLQRRLNLINKELNISAEIIMSICIGAISLARLEKDKSKSDQILKIAYQQCLYLIEIKKEF